MSFHITTQRANNLLTFTRDGEPRLTIEEQEETIEYIKYFMTIAEEFFDSMYGNIYESDD
jgi:hypothetical protein